MLSNNSVFVKDLKSSEPENVKIWLEITPWCYLHIVEWHSVLLFNNIIIIINFIIIISIIIRHKSLKLDQFLHFGFSPSPIICLKSVSIVFLPSVKFTEI